MADTQGFEAMAAQMRAGIEHDLKKDREAFERYQTNTQRLKALDKVENPPPKRPSGRRARTAPPTPTPEAVTPTA